MPSLLVLFALPGIAKILVTVLILFICIAVIWWLAKTFLPEPLQKIALAVIVVLGAVVLIVLLYDILGQGGGTFP